MGARVSVLLNGTNSTLSRAGILSATDDLTYFFRFELHSADAEEIIMANRNASAQGFFLYVDSNRKLGIYDQNAGGAVAYGSTVLTLDTIHTVWLQLPAGAGVTAQLFLDGSTSAETTKTGTNSAANAVALSIGHLASAEFGNFSIQDVRCWNAIKDPSGFAAEIASDGAVVDTADLLAFWPLDVHTDLTDAFAAFDITGGGTLATGDDLFEGGGGGASITAILASYGEY